MAKPKSVRTGVYVERDGSRHKGPLILLTPMRVTVLQTHARFIKDAKSNAGPPGDVFSPVVVFRRFGYTDGCLIGSELYVMLQAEFLRKFKWAGRLKTIVRTTEEVW